MGEQMTNFIGSFTVAPSLPRTLEPLREIAYNLYWTWNHDAYELFRRIDRELWEKTKHNPVRLLGNVSQERLIELTKDDGFVAHLNRVYNNLMIYLNQVTWHQKKYSVKDTPYITYFSAEYGLTECLQTYSGGLGVLAGDHLKSASELGLPLVGVGLLYKEGYFQQYLTSDGWQQERYEINDFYNLPLTLVVDKNKKPIVIELDFPGRKVYFQIWKVLIGRVALYLLDTNIDLNNEEDKKITRALYGGNNETRIQQEIVLGIGGIRALKTLGIEPLVCHMNEGHSAFLALERIRLLIKEHHLTFNEAKEVGYYSNIFTTHTPVPAGIDVFGNDLVEKYFGKYYRDELKITDKEFYRLGTLEKAKDPENFNMAHLAINMAAFINGVSRLHGKVSKKMWSFGFKGVPFDEIPIDYITNGVHTRTHLSTDMEELLIRYLGEKFVHNPEDQTIWQRIDNIPDEELWRTHERRRERLVAFARKRLKEQLESRGASKSELLAANETLDPGALTIGFARRFATYKRATLIFHDLERLKKILNNKERPVQIIISGKAHPKDDEGKRLIQKIIQIAKDESFRKRIVFIENYDMNVARYLVEGCDVWLNNPRRPLEASGTSGMKVIANGGLNFSALDGWWDEGYSPELGWKIGNGEEYTDLEYQDEVESRQIYDVLENEIIPTFYKRGEDNLPREWISMMKASMKKLGSVFNTNRMVEQYFTKFYYKAYQRRTVLKENNWQKAKELSNWKEKIISTWNQIKFLSIEPKNDVKEIAVGEKFEIRAKIILGSLTPNEVEVQIYYGHKDVENKNASNFAVTMTHMGYDKDTKVHEYYGSIICQSSGLYGFTLRILPKHELLVSPFELGVNLWA